MNRTEYIGKLNALYVGDKNCLEELITAYDEKDKEIERLNNIISKIETLVINHNCDTGDIYYKYNGRYLKSELKDRILELKGCDKE